MSGIASPRFSFFLSLCLFLSSVPAALYAQSPVYLQARQSFVAQGELRLLTPGEMEALHACGWVYQPVLLQPNPGRVILWDEGPESALRLFSVREGRVEGGK